ncbi:MAG: NADH:ubiquinone oxidoreductase subunit, partial [Calditrichae bacterium]|nr:NADH:ubiquinone oxidoreductase subunit [Calditrichia bacterium]
PDLNFTLETVNCLGACALGPVVVVNGEYRGQMDMAKTGDVIENIQDNVNGEKS